MSTLGLSGVFSGINTDAFIAKIIAISARPIARLEVRKVGLEGKISAVDSIATQLGYLKNVAETLADTTELQSMTAKSSDTSIMTTIASSGALEGVHSIEINQLALSHTSVHDGLDDETTTLGTSNARNVNGMADADATWFTTTANGAIYTFDFGDETDIDSVTFAASTSYSLNQAAALINVRSQAVSSYDAASVVEDTGTFYLELDAEFAGSLVDFTQSLTGGDAVAKLNDGADWTETDGQVGTLVYTYDGVTRTITTGQTTSLEDLAAMINNDAENPGVTASILQYEVDSTHVYHLVLSGNETGAGKNVTIDAGTTLTGFSSGSWTPTQTAQDAQIRVDGYPAADWIERSSNTISDVLPNVTLNLLNTGTETVTLSKNTASVKAVLTGMVDTYNQVADVMDQYTGYDEENETSGPLQGTYAIPNILSSIRLNLAGSARGFLFGTDTYTQLVEIGIEFDGKGRLELDSSVLDAAIAADYAGVLSVLGAKATGASDDTYIQFSSALDSTEAGTYEVKIGFTGSGAINQAQIRTKGESVWRSATWVGNTVSVETDTPEAGLVFTATWDGVSSSQTAEIRVLQGFGGALYDLLDAALDEDTGAVEYTKARFESQVESLEANIERQTVRLEREEERLRMKFARLEVTLARLESQSGAFSAMITSLNVINNLGSTNT